jgi:hypothetical protein
MATFRPKKKKTKYIIKCCWEEDRQSVILPLWVIDEPPINMQKEMMWQ